MRPALTNALTNAIRSAFNYTANEAADAEHLIKKLFANGEQGVWYDPSDLSTLFQDAAGTTPVTAAGQPVGRIEDESGNGNDGAQPVTAARLTYEESPSRLTLDKVDDAITIEVPAGGWNGHMVLATDQGTASYGVSIPEGTYELGGQYFPGTSINGLVIRDGAVSASDLSKVEARFAQNGAKAGYGDVTRFNKYWRDMGELTSFPLIDTSSGTDFEFAWYNCSSLTSFPLINTSSGVNFRYAWNSCSALTSFPLIDTSSGVDFRYAWYNCSSLTSFPLIDTSSGVDFRYAWYNCSALTSFPLIDTSSGTDFYAAWYKCSSLTSFPLIDTSSGVNFRYAWNSCSALTSFPLIDTSNGTIFYAAWYNCSSLTSFPLIDTSSGVDFRYAWNSCSALTSFPANMFDNCNATNFGSAFRNTKLSQQSIDGILTSINSNGTSNGTFDQSGGSAPSTTGEAAIDAMRARGWTITVTGGY